MPDVNRLKYINDLMTSLCICIDFFQSQPYSGRSKSAEIYPITCNPQISNRREKQRDHASQRHAVNKDLLHHTSGSSDDKVINEHKVSWSRGSKGTGTCAESESGHAYTEVKEVGHMQNLISEPETKNGSGSFAVIVSDKTMKTEPTCRKQRSRVNIVYGGKSRDIQKQSIVYGGQSRDNQKQSIHLIGLILVVLNSSC